MNKAQKDRLKVVIILSICIAIICMGILLFQKLGIPYKCPTKEAFNIDCPGCGGTRMVMEMLHGNIYQSFRYNPFLFITLLPMTIIGIYQSIKFVIQGIFSNWFDKLLIAYAVSLVVFGVLRNMNAFGYLKPTVI